MDASDDNVLVVLRVGDQGTPRYVPDQESAASNSGNHALGLDNCERASESALIKHF
jgi:hypothetical protein